mgnify:CR=1 FL=1
MKSVVMFIVALASNFANAGTAEEMMGDLNLSLNESRV